MKHCIVEGCTKPGRRAASNGFCEMHYYRFRRYGSTDPGPRAHLPLSERFHRHVEKTDSCWIWTGALDGHGYGQTSANGRRLAAHRVSFELSKGSIPEGMDIDHLCRNPRCVNPDHLEAVTRGENTRRGILHQVISAKAAARKTCGKGHPWTPENTYLDPAGKRRCRSCERINWDKCAAKRRARTKPRELAAWHHVSSAFGVSRSVAYRWLAGYRPTIMGDK